jgi:conjugal transfer pilus assembly protein TraI
MRWSFTSKTLTPAPPSSDDWVQVKFAQTLLANHEIRLQRIRRAVGVPNDYWHRYYQPCIDAFAQYVQQLPASEAHHHRSLGGLLEHSLEVIEHTLKLRQGKLLPMGAEAEELARTHDVWTFAAVTAALFHDVGKPVVDQAVILFGSDGSERPWCPWTNPTFQNAAWYRVSYVQDRQFALHEQISLLLVPLILPHHCLSWLSHHSLVLRAWTATLLGDSSKAGILGEIVHQADGLSVANNLSGGHRNVQISTARQIPLSERLVTALRYLLDQKKLPLNTDGAAGWLIDDELWLVVKRTLDELKSHLAAEGQTGVPGRNERLMDELQQNAVLTPNPHDKAIWKATVLGDGWAKGHTLTMLRLPVSSIWFDASARPASFEGSITVETETSSGETDNRTNAENVQAGAPRSKPIVVDEYKNFSDSSGLHDSDGATAGNEDNFIAPEITQSENLPLPPVFNAVTTMADTESQHNRSVDMPATPDTTNDDEEDQGVMFLQWLRQGLNEKTLLINVVNARVHTVPEGVLLVSPGIFKDFNLSRWSYVQKRFQKLKVNEKTCARGENIHSYLVDGPRKKNRVIKGFLITEIVSVFPGITLPHANPHLRKKME